MLLRIYTLFLMLFYVTTVTAEQPYVFARAPQLSPTLISKLWSPFIKTLSTSINKKIILKIYHSREEFESDLRKGNVDFYFGNPGYGVVGHLRHGYIPLIRSDKKKLEGIIVVKKDSGIKNISQLQNKIISFPSKTSFAASLFLRKNIDTQFNINYKTSYSGTHDNTYRAILIGKVDAGGGVTRTLQQEDKKLREQLKIIYTSPGIQPHPIMAHPKVPKEIQQAVQKAILDLDKSENGKGILKKIKLQKPVIANYKRDYKNIEGTSSKMYRYLLN